MGSTPTRATKKVRTVFQNHTMIAGMTFKGFACCVVCPLPNFFFVADTKYVAWFRDSDEFEKVLFDARYKLVYS